MVDTAERREFGDFSEPYFTERLMVYSRKSDKLTYLRPADFEGHGWNNSTRRYAA